MIEHYDTIRVTGCQGVLSLSLMLTIPIATVLSGVIDFVLAFILLLGMMLFYGIVPTINIIWLPLLLLLALTTSLGLWLSALNVQFRDVR